MRSHSTLSAPSGKIMSVYRDSSESNNSKDDKWSLVMDSPPPLFPARHVLATFGGDVFKKMRDEKAWELSVDGLKDGESGLTLMVPVRRATSDTFLASVSLLSVTSIVVPRGVVAHLAKHAHCSRSCFWAACTWRPSTVSWCCNRHSSSQTIVLSGGRTTKASSCTSPEVARHSGYSTMLSRQP